MSKPELRRTTLQVPVGVSWGLSSYPQSAPEWAPEPLPALPPADVRGQCLLFCPRCGFPTADSSQFCARCRSRLCLGSDSV